MLHSQKKGGKKPQGATSQRKKPASFIKSPTFIKTSCGAGRYQPPPIPLPPPKTPPNLSPWHPPSAGSSVPPRGPLSSENAVRSLIQREAPAYLPPPSAPVFSQLFPGDAPRFLENRGAARRSQSAGGLGVYFPQPETCKACISSEPTPNPQPLRLHMTNVT